MNVLIIVPRNEESGLGHFYRMEALAGECARRGHLTDMIVLGKKIPFNLPDVDSYFIPSLQAIVDSMYYVDGWVVFDFPEVPPVFLSEKLSEKLESAKVCVVDGVGHAAKQADLVISQGFEGKHSAPEYLLLRRGLAGHRWTGPEGPTLVWGGGADPMDLVPAFVRECPDEEAFILPPSFGPSSGRPTSWTTGKRHWTIHAEDDALFGMMATCGKAVVACGMILWELSALGVPIYVFSKTERHLETAMRMEDAGLVLAWPEVGLPPAGKLARFVNIPFVPVGKRPDGLGPMRVVKLMENNL